MCPLSTIIKSSLSTCLSGSHPAALWPLSAAKSYLPLGLYRVFHSFIIYLQCPVEFLFFIAMTFDKNLMVWYFSHCVHLRFDFGWILVEVAVDGLEEQDRSADILLFPSRWWALVQFVLHVRRYSQMLVLQRCTILARRSNFWDVNFIHFPIVIV